MSKSFKNSNRGLFNSIYVEEAAYQYPITKQLLKKYSDCTVISIRHYKDVFNRINQLYGIQKHHRSLILAMKNDPFLYKGPGVCQSFGYPNFHYASFLLNCIFDCEYCYLQGMYPSANLVAFVNVEDFQDAIRNVVSKEPVFLAASYDTDLIAFHNVIPYLDYFYDFFTEHPNLFVEIRTKSADRAFYSSHYPIKNIVIAFTLTPQIIIQKYERHTPSLDARLKAVKAAIEAGFKVRICLDPVFIHPELDASYEPFYQYIFSQIDPNNIVDIGYGFFRMSRDFFRRIEKRRVDSQLFSEEYCINGDIISYSALLQEEVQAKHLEILTRYIEKEKIFSV